jgi:Putative F0F1-ATPase subunit Ca2+/Mg2+ transporter
MTAPPPGDPVEPTDPTDPVKPLPGAWAFVGLGTTVAGCVAVGVGGGIALDAWLHTSPLFLVIGLVLGLAAAVATVVAQVRRFL